MQSEVGGINTLGFPRQFSHSQRGTPALPSYKNKSSLELDKRINPHRKPFLVITEEGLRVCLYAKSQMVYQMGCMQQWARSLFQANLQSSVLQFEAILCGLLSEYKEPRLGAREGVTHAGQSWSWKMEEGFLTIGQRRGWKCYSEKLLSTFQRGKQKKVLGSSQWHRECTLLQLPRFCPFFPTVLSPLLLSQEQ